MTKYICDKCGSTDVKVRVIRNENEEVAPTPMSGMSNDFGVRESPLVYVYTHYQAVCQSCGNSVDFSK